MKMKRIANNVALQTIGYVISGFTNVYIYVRECGYQKRDISFGGGRGNGKDFDRDAFETRGESAEDTSQTAPQTDMPQMPDMENFNPAEQLEGQLPENFDASDLPEDFTPSERPEGEKGGRIRLWHGFFGCETAIY